MESQVLSSLKGAGLIGLPLPHRERLKDSMGTNATLGSWLKFIKRGQHVEDGDAHLAEQLAKGVDGTEVSKFSLPKSLSVELSVRVNDYEPCTSRCGIHSGYEALAKILHDRALEDEVIFGSRTPNSLVAKWKLFPSARTVRQKQIAWPFGLLAACDIKRIAKIAMHLFNDGQGDEFQISRLVLGVTYAEPGSARTLQAKGKQVSIMNTFQRSKPDSKGSASNLQAKRKQVSLMEAFKRSKPPPQQPAGCIVLE